MTFIKHFIGGPCLNTFAVKGVVPLDLAVHQLNDQVKAAALSQSAQGKKRGEYVNEEMERETTNQQTVSENCTPNFCRQSETWYNKALVHYNSFCFATK